MDYRPVIDSFNFADMGCMAFKTLVNKPMAEPELINSIVSEVQSNYPIYQNINVFIKLSKTNERTSQISWIKVFDDFKSLIDFYYDTKFERACIMVKFARDHYEVLLMGHFLSDWLDILPDKIRNSRPFECASEREQKLMIPRELIEQAFGEISQTLLASKHRKAM